jgi:RNA polymerase sigma-70 factor (ECF subfamily)
LLALFAEDATWTADGGGKAKAATKVARSAERISRFAVGVWRRYTAGLVVSIVPINGELGLLMSVHGTPKSTISISSVRSFS